jgi:hypothetical protein
MTNDENSECVKNESSFITELENINKEIGAVFVYGFSPFIFPFSFTQNFLYAQLENARKHS